MDVVVSFGKTCRLEGGKDIFQKLHYALLYDARRGRKSAAEMGKRPQPCDIAN